LWAFSATHASFRESGPVFSDQLDRYFEDRALEFLTRGGISLLVTISNVLCIYAMGILFLKIKEVAPVASADQRQFWKHDIKIARDYNKTLNGDDALKLKEELAEFREHECDNFKGVGAELLKTYPNAHATWSPLSSRHHRKDYCNTRTSLHDIEGYLGNTSDKSEKQHRNGLVVCSIKFKFSSH